MQNKREADLLNKANQAIEKRDYTSGEKLLAMVIELNPRNTQAVFQLASLCHAQGKIGKSINLFNKVLQLDPNHTDAAISLSILYNDIGRYEEAKVIFERANEKVKSQASREGLSEPHVNKKFASKHFELGDLYLTYNRFDEALFEYNKAVQLNPDNLEIRVKVAKTLAKKGFLSKAFEELTRLKNEHPGFLPARTALGVLLYGNGKVLEAQNEWKSVVSRDPNNSEAQMYLNLSQTATETSLSREFSS